MMRAPAGAVFAATPARLPEVRDNGSRFAARPERLLARRR